MEKTKKSTTKIYCRCDWCSSYFRVDKRMKFCSRSCRQKQSYQMKRITKVFEETGVISDELNTTIRRTHLCTIGSKHFKEHLIDERNFLVIKANKSIKKGDVMIINELSVRTGNKTGRQLSRTISLIVETVEGMDTGNIVLCLKPNKTHGKREEKKGGQAEKEAVVDGAKA